MSEEAKGQYMPSWSKKQYLVAEDWGHYFVGWNESTVRWVLEIGVGVIAGQVLNGARWEDMRRSEIVDMQQEIDDNSVVEDWQTEYGGVIEMVTELPAWACGKQEVAIQHDHRSVQPDQVARAERTLRSLWDYQRAHKQFDTVLTLRFSDPAGTLVDWVVARGSQVLRRSHPFTQECFGWSIQRERAFDDTRRHVRNLPISPESEPVEQEVAP